MINIKFIDGISYYTLLEVSQLVSKSKQTIYNYYKRSNELENNGHNRLILKGRDDLDQQKTIYYTLEDIKALKRFLRYKKRGVMTEYNNRINKRNFPIDEFLDDLI